MRHLTLLLIFIIGLSSKIEAQSISGIVFDQTAQPVFYANAILYNINGQLIQGETTDENGRFILKGIEDGKYYVEVSFLGYTTTTSDTIAINASSKITMDLTINQETELLNTLTVVGRKPFLEQRADKLVINVADNLTSLNSNIMDVMKKVPGVMVVNDQLKMAGQPNVTILLDGKSTQYMDMSALLRDMPGDNIKKIEVVQQPGAEYEASGSGAIINIILKKNSLLGTSGSVYAGIGKSYDWKYNAGASFSSYQKSLNIQGGIGYNKNSYYDELQIIRKVADGTYDQVTKDPIDPLSLRANLTLDYDIDDRQRLGIATRIINSSTNKKATNETVVDLGNSDMFTLNTTNSADRSWNLFTINPYYKFEIDTNGQKLDLDFNYATFGRENYNILSSTNINDNSILPQQDYRQNGSNHIIAATIDYKYPVNNNLNLLFGAKYSDASLDNDLLAQIQKESGNWQNNLGQSNHFLFDENISAAYAKLDFNKGKWSGTAGLRYEQSISKGFAVSKDTTLQRTIRKPFPSASIGWAFTDALALNFAYSYRIDRPSYSSLNPFVYYYDPYTFEKGNPNLRPELTHSMKMNLAYQNQPFFNVEYKATNNAMVEVTEQNDATGETSRLTVNLAKNTNFNTSLFFPLDFIPKLSGYAGAIVNYREIDSKYLDQDFYRSLWSVTSVVQLNFSLPWDINTEVSGWHNSGSLEGIISGEWIYGVSFGLSKKVMDGKGKVSFGIEDAFNRFWHGNINFANMDAQLVSKWQNKVASARFSYNFGNQHMKKKSRNNGSASDQMDRIDTN